MCIGKVPAEEAGEMKRFWEQIVRFLTGMVVYMYIRCKLMMPLYDIGILRKPKHV